MERLKLRASADNLDLDVLVSEPVAEPKGIVQLVHGMCEHKERYMPLMEYFSDSGYICIIHDHRGHGGSVKSPEDLGYFYDGGWKAMVKDIKVVGDYARTRFPEVTDFSLLGHSMGSMAVRSYVKRYDKTVSRLFVVGSPSMNSYASLGKALSGAVGLMKGSRYRSSRLQKLSFGAFNEAFKDEGYSTAWVCSDKGVLEEYHKDPLCQFIFTTNGFLNLLSLMKDCYSSKGWRLGSPQMPVYFLSGAEDPCRISDEKFFEAVNFMRRLGYSNVVAELYPGMRHEILNETGKAEVWDYILNRIEQ